ncbi:hypothetical protein ANN_05066 [Periplaneta americana]|uniref:Uncharacterized protein n=1 Tax=Periplaneta americana TaxID=6978 RepID=A0ABQ8TA54_PERAM|nr:hypothetical protein ANN_05066 [Periplaneta americana]
MGNACYYSIEKLLSSSLPSKNLKVRIYKTVILPVVLYGCETSTLTLREEHRLRVFENKVLRKIFGAKRDEVTGEWRKLHNTELHALYSSPGVIRNIKSRRLRWAGHVARMGESRNAYRVLVGRPEGKRPLGRPRRRWENNIKMDLREMGYDDREWINFAQDRDQWRAYVRAARNLRSCSVCAMDSISSVFSVSRLSEPAVGSVCPMDSISSVFSVSRLSESYVQSVRSVVRAVGLVSPIAYQSRQFSQFVFFIRAVSLVSPVGYKNNQSCSVCAMDSISSVFSVSRLSEPYVQSIRSVVKAVSLVKLLVQSVQWIQFLLSFQAVGSVCPMDSVSSVFSVPYLAVVHVAVVLRWYMSRRCSSESNYITDTPPSGPPSYTTRTTNMRSPSRKRPFGVGGGK